jgi:hypothetical protein
VTAPDAAGNSATLSGQTVTVDNTVPVVAITFPPAAYAGGWAAGCGTPAADICGTATDASAGVLSAVASVRQSAALANDWTTATGSFGSATEVFLPALGRTMWTLPFAGSRFTSGAGYTIRAVATDAAGNAGQATVTFTYRP